jgi:4-hydroxy-3-methylbut-2-enyl diphosphate reductase IspH
MVESVQTVGITAGASTPDNLIEEFVTKLRKVASDGQEKSCR